MTIIVRKRDNFSGTLREYFNELIANYLKDALDYERSAT